MPVKPLGVERIHAGVDFSHVLLIGSQRFLLNNRRYVRAGRIYAEDAAISKGIFRTSSQDRHGRLLRKMKVT